MGWLMDISIDFTLQTFPYVELENFWIQVLRANPEIACQVLRYFMMFYMGNPFFTCRDKKKQPRSWTHRMKLKGVDWD